MNESKYRRIADECLEPPKEPEPVVHTCECGYDVDADDIHVCKDCDTAGCAHCMKPFWCEDVPRLFWVCKDGCE